MTIYGQILGKSFQHEHSMSTKSANKLLGNGITNRLVTKAYMHVIINDAIHDEGDSRNSIINLLSRNF